MAIIARENPYAKRGPEPGFGPRQPDRQVCSGCNDGGLQPLGNFWVIPGGGYSLLCKLHAPGPPRRGDTFTVVGSAPFGDPGQWVQPWRPPVVAPEESFAPPVTVVVLRGPDGRGHYERETIGEPFVATDADIDYLDPVRSPITDAHNLQRAANHAASARADLLTLTAPAGSQVNMTLPLPPGTADIDCLLVPASSAALVALPVAAGTIERLTRNANADRMVTALGAAVARLEALPARVTSEEEQGVVVALILSAVEEEKNIEALRVQLKAPYAAAVSTIDGAMGPASTSRKLLGVLRVRFGKALGAYQEHRAGVAAREAEEARLRAVQAAQDEAAAMARAEGAADEIDRHRALAEADAASLAQVHATLDAQDAETPVKGVRTEAGTLGFRETWEVEVVCEADVPREFMEVSMPKLRAAVKAGRRVIGGCSIAPGHGLRMGR